LYARVFYTTAIDIYQQETHKEISKSELEWPTCQIQGHEKYSNTKTVQIELRVHLQWQTDNKSYIVPL